MGFKVDAETLEKILMISTNRIFNEFMRNMVTDHTICIRNYIRHLAEEIDATKQVHECLFDMDKVDLTFITQSIKSCGLEKLDNVREEIALPAANDISRNN